MMPSDPIVRPGEPDVPEELKAFLRPFGARHRAPADVRQRALANARAIASAGGAIPRSTRPAPSVVVARRYRRLRLALACSVFAVGGIASFAALRGRTVPDLQPAPIGDTQPTPAVNLEQAPLEQGAPVQEPSAVPMQAPSKANLGRDVLADEVDLLRRARGAYGRREFSRALMLVAEHARRFSQGHLAEEREALRVRSLLSAGRTAEAHRAAEAFAIRFPRSVLLPRVTEESDAPK
jgi:hypothetical protein